MKSTVGFFSDSDVFDKVSDNNLLIKLEPCSAHAVTNVRCDENVLDYISLC